MGATDVRSRLPPSAVVAATVLALLAATAVFVVLDNRNDAPATTVGGPTMDLAPTSPSSGSDATTVPFTWLDGATSTIDDIVDGEPMVVNFFASWCPPCIGEMPDFETVSQELAGEVAFFGLAVQDRPEDASRIVETTGITYDWARDITGDVIGAAGVIQMPSTVFVDAAGEVVALHSGAVDAAKLRALIEEHFGVAS